MKRHFSRYPADVPIVATLIGDQDVTALAGKCTVISEGGLAATLPAHIPVGDVVALELRFPNAEKVVRVRAGVRHSDYPNYGLEFLALGEDSRRVVSRYCELRSRPTRALLLDTIRRYFLGSKE